MQFRGHSDCNGNRAGFFRHPPASHRFSAPGRVFDRGYVPAQRHAQRDLPALRRGNRSAPEDSDPALVVPMMRLTGATATRFRRSSLYPILPAWPRPPLVFSPKSERDIELSTGAGPRKILSCVQDTGGIHQAVTTVTKTVPAEQQSANPLQPRGPGQGGR